MLSFIVGVLELRGGLVVLMRGNGVRVRVVFVATKNGKLRV